MLQIAWTFEIINYQTFQKIFWVQYSIQTRPYRRRITSYLQCFKWIELLKLSIKKFQSITSFRNLIPEWQNYSAMIIFCQCLYLINLSGTSLSSNWFNVVFTLSFQLRLYFARSNLTFERLVTPSNTVSHESRCLLRAGRRKVRQS